MTDSDPDILLSLGTGCNNLKGTSSNSSDPGPKTGSGIGGFARRIMKLGFEIIRDSINCEKKWQEYLNSLGIQESNKNHEIRSRKYCRLNPDFGGIEGGLPGLDQVNKMDILISRTQEFAINNNKIDIVAASLVASLFYFEAKTRNSETRTSQELEGFSFPRSPDE